MFFESFCKSKTTYCENKFPIAELPKEKMKFIGHNIFDNRPIEITLANNRVQSIQEVESIDSKTWIAPALVDIQVNGFAGYDLNVATVTAADVCKMVRALWRAGTSFLCPTVVTASFDSIRNSLRAVVKACEADQMVAHSILGIHLEGPYISAVDGPRGAHPLKHVREPDLDEFQRCRTLLKA